MPTTCKLIAKNVLGSNTATVTFSAIPDTYTDLLVVGSARSTASSNNSSVLLRFNSDTGNNYQWRNLLGTGSGVSSSGGSSQTRIIPTRVTGATSTASTFASFEIHIPNYAGSANKSTSSTGVTENNATEAFQIAVAGLWSSTSAITSLDLVDNGGDFVSGSSFYLYGITKSA